ncbi:Replication factor C subunit 1 [Grifola frondosa]|uniref:Replication factor C subunit 1 n=1 Tax=Grifola frondosa TaxID=5627 RepID=A0A1C7LL82_GRIFR|nr:Replication factor C subunit 1 [Grifola frondosa]
MASNKTKPQSHKLKSERVMEDDDDDRPVLQSLKRKKPAVLISSDDEDQDIKKVSPPKKKHAVSVASTSKATGSPAKPKPKAKEVRSRRASTSTKKKTNDDDFVVSDNDEDEDFEMSEDDDDVKEKGKSKRPAKKSAIKHEIAKSASKARPHAKVEDVDVEDKPKAEFNWAAAKAARAAGPIASGSKEVPEPADPNCLAGLSFVFTGELSSFSRDDVVEMAKRYGGRVVGQPSSKTSYVVLGSDAGPRKLEAIKKNKLATLDEDGFLNLIATRVPNEASLDEKTKKKMEKKKKLSDKTLKEICGNKGQVEKLQQWLHEWSSSLHSDFKKPGKTGMNIYRAVMITGPPGIGKTTSAHLSRSKKLVENSTNISNTSLDGWMTGGHMTNAAGVTITDNSCLIMDEVDGMSAGDRGGIGALTALIKKTKIPIICIANDRGAQKLKPLLNSTFNLTFKRPEATAIRSRILSIAFKEKMKIPANVVDQLVMSSQSDIRQVINMLSTWKLSSNTMDFDEGKALAKMNEKYSVMTPFGVINKMLGPYTFSPTSRETLGDKIELYFHDPSFVPLFVQENYLKTQPARIRGLDGPEKALKHLELMEKASASLSDGDIVDSLIHGPEHIGHLCPSTRFVPLYGLLHFYMAWVLDTEGLMQCHSRNG